MSAFHDETGLFVRAPREAIYVVAWDYYEHANRLEGGGGGQEWRRDLAAASKVFAWAQEGWGEHPITVRLVRVLAPTGCRWTDDENTITEAVSAAVDLLETPEKYPASFTLIAECKWNGGAS